MTINLINKETVDLLVKGQTIDGIGILKDYSINKTKNGNDFLEGKLQVLGGTVGCKIWSGSLLTNFLESRPATPLVLDIAAKVDDFGGRNTLIIESMGIAEEKLEDVIPLVETSDYNVEVIEKEYLSLLKNHLDKPYLELFVSIYKSVRERFKEEYAASVMHDATKHGLIAHMTKILKFLDLTVSTYGNISEHIDKNLLFIGTALHDVGKIKEYRYGVRTEIAFATHNFLGQEILFEFKDKIVAVGGEDFYYRLQAILQQHHGEFGEPCQTVESYLVHLVDMFESRLTMLNEQLPFEGELRVEFGKYRLV